MRLLVTGGAGYIGSHCVTELLKAQHDVTVVDNLSTGFLESLKINGNLRARFFHEDIRNFEALRKIIREQKIEAVLHFAAKIIVPESIAKPFEYYDNNVVGSLRLIQACHDEAVRTLVFSSTAAVYGDQVNLPIIEDARVFPANPYGTSKQLVEQILKDYASSNPLFKFVALRYFNVAGASLEGDNGQRFREATHLIKVASQVVTGQREKIQIFGTDYETFDGTCIRDYIHVQDLANAHVLALEALAKGHPGGIFNCGYGRGASVSQVIEMINKVSGSTMKVERIRRREGDPSYSVANTEKIRRELGWIPKHDSLETICRSAVDWEKKLNKL